MAIYLCAARPKLNDVPRTCRTSQSDARLVCSFFRFQARLILMRLRCQPARMVRVPVRCKMPQGRAGCRMNQGKRMRRTGNQIAEFPTDMNHLLHASAGVAKRIPYPMNWLAAFHSGWITGCVLLVLPQGIPWARMAFSLSVRGQSHPPVRGLKSPAL